MDSTVFLSSKKAKELKVGDGDVVGLVGRRRRASYATVSVKKMGSLSCEISRNLSQNLRIRDGDKVKVVKNGSDDTDAEATGDMYILAESPSTADSVTLSPIEDSHNDLVATEGGDDIPDEDIAERFVTPYLSLDVAERSIFLKKGHVLTLKDENGSSLDFIVNNVELDVGDEEEAEGDGKS